jgi:uncharacterized Zn finger protein
MIRPRRECPKCGGKVQVLRVIKKRADRAKGRTDAGSEGWRCDDCGEVTVERAPRKRVDKR